MIELTWHEMSRAPQAPAVGVFTTGAAAVLDEDDDGFGVFVGVVVGVCLLDGSEAAELLLPRPLKPVVSIDRPSDFAPQLLRTTRDVS